MFIAGLIALLPWVLRLQALGLCAACRQALETSGQAGLARGLAWSVVVMLAAPISMVSLFIFTVVRSTRRNNAAQRSAAASAPAAATATAPTAAAPVALETNAPEA